MMEKISAESLREAADLIGISGQASLYEIQRRYYERIKEWHPDVSEHDPAMAHEMMIRLKNAYECLRSYCMNYPFSFELEDLENNLEQTPAEYWKKRFGDDPIWG
jgi:hypothetical protein